MKIKDKIILCNLRANGRDTLTEISKRTRIPVSTLHDKLKIYHKENLITKHTALLNFDKLGFNTRANVLIKVNRGNRDKLKFFLNSNPIVNSLYKINNGYNFLIEVICKEVRELEDLLEMLEKEFKVRTKQVFYVIEDIKREGFLSNFNSNDSEFN